MNYKRLFLFATILLISCSVNAQDVIRTKKDTIIAKVLEIGIDEIKYKEFSNLQGPVIVILKSEVIEITYENGSKFMISPDPYEANKEIAVRNKSKAIKMEFLAPIADKFVIGYETMLKVGTNLEFKVGIIGIGTKPNPSNVSGFFFKGGVKFLTSPTYYTKGTKYAHALKGFYIKPELIFNTYSRDIATGYPGPWVPYYQYQNVQFTNVALNIVLGKQHILGNIITFDYYAGIGYGVQSISDLPSSFYYDYSDYTNVFSHFYGGKNEPLVLSAGMTIGVLF